LGACIFISSTYQLIFQLFFGNNEIMIELEIRQKMPFLFFNDLVILRIYHQNECIRL